MNPSLFIKAKFTSASGKRPDLTAVTPFQSEAITFCQPTLFCKTNPITFVRFRRFVHHGGQICRCHRPPWWTYPSTQTRAVRNLKPFFGKSPNLVVKTMQIQHIFDH